MTTKPQGKVFMAFAETANLPKLELRDKRGRPQCSAFVNAYVVGAEQRQMVLPNGAGSIEKWGYPLWYVSLLGPPGSSTTLQALYAGLTDNNTHELWLDGVGRVVLGNREKAFIAQGYRTHWNYVQQPFSLPVPQGEGKKPKIIKGVHGLLEPRELSVADPMRVQMAASHRRAVKGKKGKGAAKESAVLSTGSSTASDPEVRQQAAQNPIFLLFVPGNRANDETFLHQLYLTFLGKRLPWGLRDAWAKPIWEDSLDPEKWGTTEQLDAWSYGMPVPGKNAPAAMLPDGVYPWITGGYLCRPVPDQVRKTMRRQIVGDVPEEMVLPSLSPHAQEILQLEAHAVHDALAFAGMA